MILELMVMTTRNCQKEIFGVTDEDFRIVLDYYSISDKMLKDSLQMLKEWFAREPHMPKINLESYLDDHYLSRFLAVNKFSVEKAKEKLDNLCTARNLFPEFFSNRDPFELTIANGLVAVDWIFLPQHTKENCKILLMRINPVQPKDHEPLYTFKASFLTSDLRMSLDISCGDIFVWDMMNLQMVDAVKMTPTLVKKLLFIYQQCYGARIKSIHILNLPSYAEIIVNIVKAVVKGKVGRRIHVHRTLEEMYKVLPRELFPKDMEGGCPLTCMEIADKTREAIRSPEWREWFLMSSDLKTDESKRIVQSETRIDDLIGLNGSFRKLDID